MSGGQYGNQEAVCPYCGSEEPDSWQLGDGADNSGVTECGSCGGEYRWERCFVYDTEPMKSDEMRGERHGIR